MRLSNLSFRYGRRDPWVLSGVRLAFDPGDVVEVVGPNGTGKSTLLRLLAGLLRPVKGAIEERPGTVGYAPERFPADQPFTVAAYLRHMADIRRVNPARIGEWTERLGMDHLLGRRLPELSKGSAHKVGLVQALVCEPGLLILDEPFAGLDAATRAELPRIIGEVSARGGIVVVSDHQGGLRTFPAIRRHEVRDGSVRDLPAEAVSAHAPVSGAATPTDTPTHDAPPAEAATRHAPAAEVAAGNAPADDAGDSAPVTVLEVAVAAPKAAELADRLRAEGHAVRVTREAAR